MLTTNDAPFRTEEMVTKGFDEFVKWLDDNPDICKQLGGDAVRKRVDLLKLCKIFCNGNCDDNLSDCISAPEIVKIMGKMHEMDKFAAYGVPKVFVQGDCWSNNILYNRLENGEAGDELVALIDWQVMSDRAK